jgi:hypothetical protein
MPRSLACPTAGRNQNTLQFRQRRILLEGWHRRIIDIVFDFEKRSILIIFIWAVFMRSNSGMDVPFYPRSFPLPSVTMRSIVIALKNESAVNLRSKTHRHYPCSWSLSRKNNVQALITWGIVQEQQRCSSDIEHDSSVHKVDPPPIVKVSSSPS